MADFSIGASQTPLLDAGLVQREASRGAVRQDRVFDRLAMLTLGSAVSLGRHTVSQMVVALGVGEGDWSAWHRLFNVPHVQTEALQTSLLSQALTGYTTGELLPVALDATQLPRSSLRFPGSGYTVAPRTPKWKPGIHCAQKWEGMSLLLPRTAAGDSRAIPIRWELIRSDRTRPMGAAPVRSEGGVGAELLAWLRAQLDAQGRRAQAMLAIGDGAYSTATMLARLPERTVLLARCARNRALFALPAKRLHGRGRQPRYGARGPTPEAMLHDPSGWRPVPVPVRGRTIHLRVKVTGPWVCKGAWHTPFFTLVVRGVERGQGRRRRQRDPQFWSLTATPSATGSRELPCSLEIALAWAWQRWEVEVMHRELKSGFGLGEQPAWSETGAAAVTAWMVWAYAVFVLAGYRRWGLGPGPTPRLGRWWTPRRWSFAQLWQGLRQEFWRAGEFHPVWARSPDAWREITRWRATQTNAALGCRRL